MDPRHTGMYNKESERIKLPLGECSKLLTHNRIMASCNIDGEGQRCERPCKNHCPPPRIKGDDPDTWNNSWEKYPGAASVLVLPPKRNRYPILF